MEVYAHWLRQAFPSARLRQQYFKSLIENKPISHANFRLAHLLLEKQLATLVVTPNFDDFLSRSLALFGQPHIVCDHPATTERIDTEAGDIQIVHVHGTYWFYDLCNLPSEITDRAVDSLKQAVTMPSLLTNILSRHSAIVIGYSGWENDVIMNALKRRLTAGLPINMYWFCYRRSEADALPSFLKDHDNVCAIVPPPPKAPSAAQAAAGDPKLGPTLSDSDPTLSAHFVLDKLVAAFTKHNPALIDDPIGFFSQQLTASFPQDGTDKPDDDIYRLREVIQRVALAAPAVPAAGTKGASTTEADIELVRNAVRRSNYPDAINAAKTINLAALDPAQRESLATLVMFAAGGPNDDPQLGLDGYNLVLRLTASSGAAAPTLAAQQLQAQALLRKGFILAQLDKSEDAIQVWEELRKQFRDSTDLVISEQVAKALRNKGITMRQLKRNKEGEAAFRELLERFGNATEPALREQVAKALINEGFLLEQLKRDADAVAAYDDLVKRFGDATEPALKEAVAMALFNKGISLGHLKREDEGIQTWDELLRRFGTASEPTLREPVAKALLYKGITLARLKQEEKAIPIYDDLLKRFNDSTEPALRAHVATTLLRKSEALTKLNRIEESRSALNEVVRRFADASDKALKSAVESARTALETQFDPDLDRAE